MIERFFSKVSVKGPDDCWEWQGSFFKSGYGKFSIGRKTLYAHRVSFEIKNGKIPEGRMVRHKVCDNPRCVNPAHLSLGSQKDNMCDKVIKGRQTRTSLSGESNGQAKLTFDQVVEIKELYATGIVTQQILADHFGVSRGQISNIITGHKWKDSKPACHAVRIA
ncbi:MAG: HNH endonuclease [Candidatus Izemoplasmatales bacterium]|jgi:hypothetical protein